MSTKSSLLRSKILNLQPVPAEAGDVFQLPEFTRSTTLRWSALAAAIFVAFTAVLLGFVYLKTKHDLTMRFDRVISLQMGMLAGLSPGQIPDAIDQGLRQDPAHVRLVGLFGANGERIAGNV